MKIQISIKQGIANKLSSPHGVSFISYTLLGVTAVVALVITVFLYSYTQKLLSERLYERMLSISSTASLMFSDADIRYLLEIGGRESVYTDVYIDTVRKLRNIKKANADITFAYIYGRTDDPNTVVFIADADVYALRPSLNYNEDEVTEEGFPGSSFDVSDIPILADGIGYQVPIVDEYFYDTIWGTLMTAYGPILDKNGNAVATLGLDVDISDFRRLVRATFVPFGLFVVVLLLMLSALTMTMVKMWGSRVNLLRELDRQKDELLSMVSHQLANPISAVKWNIEMMLDGDVGKLTEEQTKHLKMMYPQTQDLADLASMILDVSRIQLGRMKVDRIELDLPELIDEVCEAVEIKAKEKGLKFIKRLPEKMPKVMLDRRLTRMTLDNLLNNAVAYTKKGEVELKLSLKDGNVHYEVRDTGCGIPKADQGKIFEKLFRASNVRDKNGNGFGLYVAKGAVEAQGGTISFKSTEGKGTTFIVGLPIIREEVDSNSEGTGA